MCRTQGGAYCPGRFLEDLRSSNKCAANLLHGFFFVMILTADRYWSNMPEAYAQKADAAR